MLINGGSASASEIVAGALQDHRRDRHRHALVRQRLGADHHSARRRQWGAPADYRALLHPSGRWIQAKGISPDIEVLQEVPEKLKARTDTSGEASLRGHLKAEGDEQTGSQAYIPRDPKDDKALHTALDLMRDILKNSAYPPNPKTVEKRRSGRSGRLPSPPGSPQQTLFGASFRLSWSPSG